MKLKKTVVMRPFDADYLIIDVENRAGNHNVMLQTNETGARIVHLLLDGTCADESSLSEAMCAEYDAPPALIRAEVRRMVDCLRENGLLTE